MRKRMRFKRTLYPVSYATAIPPSAYSPTSSKTTRRSPAPKQTMESERSVARVRTAASARLILRDKPFLLDGEKF